jgi:hypothetical protein
MKESNGSIQDEAHSSFAVALVRGRKETGDPETRVGHCGCCGEMDAPERVPSRLSLESGIPRCASAVGGCLWLVQNSRASSSVDGNGLGQKALGGKKKKIRFWRIGCESVSVAVSCEKCCSESLLAASHWPARTTKRMPRCCWQLPGTLVG